MHDHPIPLSKYILDFELVSIVAFPLLLISTRVAEEFTVVAKLWGGAIALAIGLQVFAMGVRTYTYPMSWSLQYQTISGVMLPPPAKDSLPARLPLYSVAHP